MATPKIVLSPSRDIPFNKLVLSQANVRKVKAGVSIEDLAEDIARRTLLHGLAVRPVLDAEGAETGVFEVPVGGRRFRALELLVKQKRMSRTQPVPCVVRDAGLAEEDSLAENLQRAPLHPLDQFRTFQTLREAGLGEEEIAARFFVTPAVVKQRLKLAAVAPALLDAYAEERMTLEQLMAFTVSGDHARQEQPGRCSTGQTGDDGALGLPAVGVMAGPHPRQDGRHELAAGDETDHDGVEAKPLVHMKRKHRQGKPDDQEGQQHHRHDRQQRHHDARGGWYRGGSGGHHGAAFIRSSVCTKSCPPWACGRKSSGRGSRPGSPTGRR
ncbi:hypothetical protein TSO221_30525 [Azospirillum sp. TSO22-1]|nr:hypothetical protein TSO221_30525 [Azospirillum sp. TSO22-1]